LTCGRGLCRVLYMAYDVTITAPVLLVLNAIGSATGGVSGYNISLTTGLSSGSLYPILHRLEKAEWLSSEWEKAEPSELKRPRRRLYTLTEGGRDKMKQMAATLLNNAG